MMLEREDIRGETLMAWWLENDQFAMESIIVRPEGTFHRSIAKDVRKTDPAHPSPGETITVHLNREGLYDMLPEALFHEVKRKPKKSIEESVEESLRYKAEEKVARRFFLPLEQEFYRFKVSTEQAELSTCMSSIRSDYVNSFLQFWSIDGEAMSYNQKNFLLALLPQLNRIAGDMNKVAICLQILLGEKVNIRETESVETIGDNGLLSSRLGSTFLGVDAILNADFFEDDAALEVVIGPVKLEDLHGYLSGGQTDRLLKRLYTFFFPAEGRVISSIVVDNTTGTFALKEEAYTSRLGFTTVL